MTLLAALVTALSLILCANVYAAIWRRLQLPTDPRRLAKLVRVTYEQTSKQDRINGALCVVVAVLWVGLL